MFAALPMANEVEGRWEGKVSAKVTDCSVDQIWPLLEDFFNFHKCISGMIDTCYGIEGISGQPGCIRYCSKESGNIDSSIKNWANEKLISIDPFGKSLCYKLVENNMGFESHLATIELVPFENGCEVIWSFGLKPIEGLRYHDAVSIYETAVKDLAKNVKIIIQA